MKCQRMEKQQIKITGERLTTGVRLQSPAAGLEEPDFDGRTAELLLPASGGGILLPECLTAGKRYLTFFLTVEEEHSMAFNWNFYVKGETAPAFTVRFGLLGGVRSLICLDLRWTDAHVLFPEHTVGQQKVVCHGRRITREETERVELVGLPCFHDVKIRMEEVALTDDYPEKFPLDVRPAGIPESGDGIVCGGKSLKIPESGDGIVCGGKSLKIPEKWNGISCDSESAETLTSRRDGQSKGSGGNCGTSACVECMAQNCGTPACVECMAQNCGTPACVECMAQNCGTPACVECMDQNCGTSARVDCFGQNKRKHWTGKTENAADLKARLTALAEKGGAGFPFDDWTAYGGWRQKRLNYGTGFFASCKENGRWWLVDPEGYAFFSVGPDCVNVNGDCRVDGLEAWLEGLPARDDPEFADCWQEHPGWSPENAPERVCTLFSYPEANLRRAFGAGWYGCWQKMVAGQLRAGGLNTIGNWSDPVLFGTCSVPYVTSLPEFPGTKQMIFRDFPDVFSAEYAKNAEKSAQALKKRKDDPWMIGYFLRNEPSWAFVDNLVLADEVLYNPARTACREALLSFLREKYGTAERLNAAWNTAFDSMDALYERQEKFSERYPKAAPDLKEFSRRMLRAYVEIPAKACRRADPNHMILGMRWAWISDPDLVCGWENFDVFSINCYAQDPTAALDHIRELGVDLPVMIGEFHFGALDAGPEATGLEGVRTQRDRGIAYRYYCERVAAHPCGVGCHWFQCYDQFTLGRFDGENYNIGLFDICLQPYPEMMESVSACSASIYRVACGMQKPTEEKAESIPMIAY